MIEERARGLDQEALRMFRSSYMKRYEQWKRGGLLLIAIQTMPKQVKKEEVIDNLIKLRSKYEKDSTTKPNLFLSLQNCISVYRITNKPS